MKKSGVAIAITAIVCVTVIITVGIICAFDWLKEASSNDYDEGTNIPESLIVANNEEIKTDDINGIKIDWINGKITVKYHDAKTISVTESSEDHDNPILCYVEDETLEIKEFKNKVNKVNIKNKDLVVALPKDFDLYKLTVNNVNGTLIATDLNVEVFNFDTVNGNGDVSFSMQPKRISFDTVNANLKLTLPSDITGFVVDKDVVSAKVDTKAFGGKLTMGNEAIEINVDSVNGNLKLYKGSEAGIPQPEPTTDPFDPDNFDPANFKK